MGPEVQHTGEKLEEAIELRVYTGNDGVFTLYEDEGDNYNYENGSFATTTIRWDEKKQLLTFEERKGSFTSMAAERDFKIVAISLRHSTGYGDEVQPDILVHYDGRKLVISIPFTNSKHT